MESPLSIFLDSLDSLISHNNVISSLTMYERVGLNNIDTKGEQIKQVSIQN